LRTPRKIISQLLWYTSANRCWFHEVKLKKFRSLNFSRQQMKVNLKQLKVTSFMLFYEMLFFFFGWD